MKSEIQLLVANDINILFTDECVFSYRTLEPRAYSNKHLNITMDEGMLKTEMYSVVAAISQKHGLVHFNIFNSAVNVDKFLVFLTGVAGKSANERTCIFLDNLRVHHAKRVTQFIGE